MNMASKEKELMGEEARVSVHQLQVSNCGEPDPLLTAWYDRNWGESYPALWRQLV